MRILFEKNSGIKAHTPLDTKIDLTGDKQEDAKKIRESNIDLIKKFDFVIADINKFRGEEPDSGVSFEVGYAAALGKQIVLYREDHQKNQIVQSGVSRDANGFAYEDFDLPVNLMFFGENVKITNSLKEASLAVKEAIIAKHLSLCSKNGEVLEFISFQEPCICQVAAIENPKSVCYIKDDTTKSLIEADIKFKSDNDPEWKQEALNYLKI